MEKVIIIGIDGADYYLTRDLMAQGALPNLKALSQRGHYGILRSTTPPLTPQAWSSLVCSVNPGKHGVFDFGEIPYDSYESRLNTSLDRKTRGFWEYFAEEGLSSSVINLPLSYPAEEMASGYMVAGMHTPDLPSLACNSKIQKRILEHHGDYLIDVMSFWYKDRQYFLNQVKKMTQFRLKLIQDLRKQFPVDVLFAVFVGLDRVAHAFYDVQDFVIGDQGFRYQSAVRDIYQQIDTCIGEMLNGLEGAYVIVVSDHGFGNLEKDVYLNNYLLDSGYLGFHPHLLRQNITRHPNYTGGLCTNLALRLLTHLPYFQKKIPWQQKSMRDVDLSKTKAFATGLFGNVFLHRKGRFPQGFLDPQSDAFEEIRASLMMDLMALRDQGEPIVDEIYINEETYHGPYTDKAADLLLKMRNYSYITRGGFEFHSNQVLDYPAVDHCGNHRMEGILFFSGPQIQPGSRGGEAELFDVLPTLMAALDLPIPLDFDGQVLGFLQTKHRPRMAEQMIYRQKTGSLPLDQDKEVEGRLRALGYIP